MTNWYETHAGIWAQVWATLAQGVSDAHHPARRPTLATVSPDNWPEARTVVLRTADAAQAQISVHTDINADKIRSLRATPRAALHIWDAAQALQIRLQATVQITTGPSLRALWDSIPDHAQQSYGVVPPPGTPIADALAYDKTPDPACFAVLHCQVCHIDAVHLGVAHRRAAYSRTRHWAGEWLSP